MIPAELLTATEGRATAVLVYGASGTKKTHGIHTLPPPILALDFEGGNQSIMPWLRSRVDWNGERKINYTDEDRNRFSEMVKPELRSSTIKPGPYIDLIWFDPLKYESYMVLMKEIASFDKSRYNSISIDSLQEFCAETQTYSRGPGKENLTMTETGSWGGAQERAMLLLRYIRSLRDQGIFTYMTCSEMIDKDYVTDPRNQKKGASEEPFLVKGTANLPGKLTSFVQHICDLQLHGRSMMGNVVWVSKPEPVGGGSAMWEVKDRFGRLVNDYNQPNCRLLLDQVYGEETRKKIYAIR